MALTDISVRSFSHEEGDAVLAKAEYGDDRVHRWWFYETDSERLVLSAEVIEDQHGKRYYVDEDEFSVPSAVRTELEDDYSGLFDNRGKEI